MCRQFYQPVHRAVAAERYGQGHMIGLGFMRIIWGNHEIGLGHSSSFHPCAARVKQRSEGDSRREHFMRDINLHCRAVLHRG